MEVSIVSTERIKPSSSTPDHLRTFKLCLLDQLIPAPYAPLVLVYLNEDGATHLQILDRVEALKKSLSETLTRFYPLAGQIKDDLTIDCDDGGACFVETKVNCFLGEFLNRPDLQLIHRFLPCEAGFTGPSAGTPVASIQVNVFKCGGIAIGLCISHKIFDGASLSTFMKAWAAAASGAKQIPYPDFAGASLFPANDTWLRDSSMTMWSSLFKTGRCKTRRFVFDASAIATLKAKAATSSVHSPTRVEAVSAFLWKSAMEARLGYRRPSLLSHVVNLRPRTAPNLPENSIGNLIWIASAECTAEYDQLGLRGLVGKVKRGISEINSELAKKLMRVSGNERFSAISKSLKRVQELGSKSKEVDYYGFTSWCNLGFYEADIGWGRPVWVSGIGSCASVFMNLIVLMDTRSGNGIEAWVTLDEEEMAILESDLELLTFASLDPSPLRLCKLI
ncbi:stemmadenine O-acetyltransferase-like [Diospyros lotus]|uniref:stemmadenine O-acetyltransferase-like n=1 Tax=Diospyros lotus TaxID=55363 RepID=UPI00225AC684|nr:stemmadenine O-acetyltransferase-like [Diospyros lotus]